ncbi:hypothetical protein [uncultured Bacteroides sp.]|uniref:hypothetical protein n=1 Tax=uncultured Bacteroides sp. TaxID=162156 RepID=UPI00261597A5|nr:hypothetical protein [uncultured Bacteroides sp.]
MAQENQATQEPALNVPELESINQAEELAVTTNQNGIKMENTVKQNAEQENRTTVNVALNIFTEDKVFSLSDYIENIVLEVIGANRKVESQIAEKLKSCEAYGMLVPGIFVDSSIARKAGYECEVVFGTPDGRKPHFCIMEGNTRFHAFLKALEKAKNDSNYKAFKYRFTYEKFDDPKRFRDTYRAINMSNEPTRTKDFVRDLLATGENKILSSYQNKLKRKITAKAAGFATANREIMKRDVNAIFKDSAPDYITDESILEFTTPVYEAVLKAFGCDEENKMIPILKGTIIWKFNSEKFKAADDKKIVSDRLVKLYNGLSSATTANILNAKKKAKKTKEQVIVDILEKEYKKLNENQ